MNAETIEKWKQNRVVCHLLTDTEFTELCSFGIENLQWHGLGGDWYPNYGEPNRTSSLAYRLRPDYEPPKYETPKYVRCKIEVVDNHYLRFKYTDVWPSMINLANAVNFVKFSHFEYADGEESGHPRRFSPTEPAEYPKYVVFYL